MTTMQILCPETTNGPNRVPPVGLCECGTAIELEHQLTKCLRCGFTWAKDGELVGVPPDHHYAKQKP